MEPIGATSAVTTVSTALIFLLVAFVALLLFGLILYVLRSISLYKMAKRRKIKGSLMAWLPVLWMCLLGRISDQYRANAKLTHTRRAGTLTTLVVLSLMFAVESGVAIGLGMAAGMAGYAPDVIMVLVITGIVLMTVALVTALMVDIVVLVCLYDAYASSRPKGAVVFLLLTIFFPWLRAVLLYACRRHDKGLPLPVDPPVAAPVDPDMPAVTEQTILEAEPVSQEAN